MGQRTLRPSVEKLRRQVDSSAKFRGPQLTASKNCLCSPVGDKTEQKGPKLG